jgi:FdhE protein
LPEWADVLNLHIALLELHIQSAPPPIPFTLSAEEATQRRRAGIPLLGGHELQPDWPTFTELVRQVCQTAAAHRPDLAQAFHAIQDRPQEQPEQVRSWIRRYLAENKPDETDNEGIITFALNQALRPFLRRFALDHGDLLDDESWRQGYCPVCGGEPDYAALGSQDEGRRYLLCSRCDNEWSYKRLGCPFCENADHNRLSYFPEQAGPHRIYVCDQCQRYLKAIDLRGALGRVLLPVERILTIPMDVAAREQGYR